MEKDINIDFNSSKKITTFRFKSTENSEIQSRVKFTENDPISTATSNKETEFFKNFRLTNKKKDMTYKLISGRDVTMMIQSEFENPNSYLNTDKELTIVGNKGHSGPRFDKNNQVIPHSIVGSVKIFNNNNLKDFKNSTRSLSVLIPNTNPMIHQRKKLTKNCQKINNQQFFNIIKDVKSRVLKNNINEFMNEVPKELKKSLKLQEDIFKVNFKQKKEFNNLNNYLCLHSNKNKKDLLANQTHSNKIKNEILEIIENKKSNLGNNQNNWLFSLRKSALNDTENHTYNVNYKNNSQLWSTILIKKEINEMIGCELDENILPNIEKLKKKKFIHETTRKFDINFDKLKQISELKVEGKSILLEEVENISKIKNKLLLLTNPNDNELPINEVYRLNYLKSKSKTSKSCDALNFQIK